MVLDFFHWRIRGGGVMFKNVLRVFFALLTLTFTLPALSAWNIYSGGCNVSVLQSSCNSLQNSGWIVRVINAYPTQCSGAGYYQCQNWQPKGSSPCTLPQTWNQTNQACQDPPPPSCDDLAGSSWNGEACVCPSGTTPGYQCTVSNGCSNSCINPNPPPGCPEGQLEFEVDGEPRCFDPSPPDTCPEGSYPITYNGVDQCWTPDQGGDQCPEGTYYVEINEVGQCFNPQPNIEDPGSSSSSSSTSTSTSSGGGGSSSSSGGGSGTSIDLSGVTSRLDQLKNKADSTNSKLDDANETLTGIKDILEGEGGTAMPEHSTASVENFGAANAAFMGRLNSAPVVVAFGSIAGLVSVAGAQCPALDIDFPEPIATSVSSTMHCDIYTSHVAPVLSAIMYACYLFIGFRIFASA